MRAENTSIPGLVDFRPEPHRDSRGLFTRTFDHQVASAAGIDPSPSSRTASRAPDGVRSGACTCASATAREAGALLPRRDLRRRRRPPSVVPDVPDVVVLRPRRGVQKSIFIPPGCAHGFQSLSEPADTFYRINRLHDPSEDLTIAYDDPELAIPWPLPVTDMSENDRPAAPLGELADRLAASTGE